MTPRHGPSSKGMNTMKSFKAAHCLLIMLAMMGVAPMSCAQSNPTTSSSGEICQKVVQDIFGYIVRSSVFDLRARLQAHELVTRILNKAPTPGEGWREGNPYWEEAYTVYYPGTYQFIKDQVVRDMEYQQSVWPKQMDLALCNNYEALANTSEGKAAIKKNVANALDGMLKEVQLSPSSAYRLQAWLDSARHEVEEARQAANLEKFLSDPSSYSKTQQKLKEYENTLTQNLKPVSLSGTPEAKQSASEYFTAMNARNRDKLIDIAQRFRGSAR
jgi:hypothetical protein